MRMIKKIEFYLFMCMAFLFSATSCSDEDPDLSNVNPPVVAVTHSISGRVTAIDGEGISATVSMNGVTVETNENGMFVFEKVVAGTYTLKAEAKGKESKQTVITVKEGNSNNPVWNVTLSNEGVAIAVNNDGSAKGNISSEVLDGNENGKIGISLTAPAGSVEAGTQIMITPIYSAEDVQPASLRSFSTKAAKGILLIGSKIISSDASAILRQPVNLEYDVDPEIAKTVIAQKYVNGQWVDAEFSVSGGKVTVIADQFTSYSLLCSATVSSSTTSEEISFKPNSWDNLKGTSAMPVVSSSYSYKIGTDISLSGNNKIIAYLIEIIAREAGAGMTIADASYPINVTLPVGTAMSINGRQEVTTLTASVLGRSVSGKRYGSVFVVTQTWNRQHTGGGSK